MIVKELRHLDLCMLVITETSKTRQTNGTGEFNETINVVKPYDLFHPFNPLVSKTYFFT